MAWRLAQKDFTRIITRRQSGQTLHETHHCGTLPWKHEKRGGLYNRFGLFFTRV